MARKVAQTSLKGFTEVNLTPLIDLSFLLLVTFIITMPVIQQEMAIPMNLPKGDAKDLPNTKKHSISIDKKGTTYLDGTSLSLDQLKGRMTEVARVDSTVTILVRADEGIKYGDVVNVLKILHDLKLTKVALVTQSEGKAKPRP